MIEKRGLDWPMENDFVRDSTLSHPHTGLNWQPLTAIREYSGVIISSGMWHIPVLVLYDSDFASERKPRRHLSFFCFVIWVT